MSSISFDVGNCAAHTIEQDGLKILISGSDFYEHATSNLRKYEGPLDTVIDIGAHAGSLSLYAALRGARHIVAIEPFNFPLLAYNIVQNGLGGRVVPLGCAISRDGGDLPFAFLGNDGTFTFMSARPPSIAIASLRFRDLLAFAPSGTIDYLKIDVEGAESNFLDASALPVLSRTRFLDLECHNLANPWYSTDRAAPAYQFGSPLTALHAFLRKAGFSTILSGIHVVGYNRKFKE